MKTYNTIADLKDDLNLTKPSPHPNFFIYKHKEIGKVKKAALEPQLKNFFSIEFIADESWSMKVGETDIEEVQNCIIFNSPHQLFLVNKFNNTSQTRGITAFFTGDLFHPPKHQFQIQQQFPYFKLNSSPHYKLNGAQQAIILELLEKLYEESEGNDDQSLEITRAYLLILLNNLNRILDETSTLDRYNRSDEITRQFEQLILTESETLKTISDYAKKMNMTPAYLSECSKNATGLPAKKILANYTLLRSKSLISQTTKTIDEIAHIMGFSETTNFIKFFKKNMGITPKTYRKLPNK